MSLPPTRRNLGLTTFLAFGGTTFSTFVVGGLCYAAGQMGLCYPMGLLASLVFGSLISATDPVSVLSVFKACGVPDDVFAIVFGESVLNDAVAIVLTRTLLAFDDVEVDASAIIKAVLIFLFDFASSLAIGAGFGLASAATLRRFGIATAEARATAAAAPTTPATPATGDARRAAGVHASSHASASAHASSAASDDENEVLLTVALCFAFPWMSFYVAEALQMSGVVTLLFCGVVMSTAFRPLMGAEAARVATTTFRAAALTAETFVFIYLGEAIFSFPILHGTNWRLVGVALVACGLGRSHVFLGVKLANLYRGTAGSIHSRSCGGGGGGGALAGVTGCRMVHPEISSCSSNGNGKSGGGALARRLSSAHALSPLPAPYLDSGVSLVVWWSGLRGGVAFALASASYGSGDFTEHCGGWSSKSHRTRPVQCVGDHRGMTDGLAILQATLIIATLGIFVLGGSIKDVAVCCGVLKRAPAPV